MRFVIFYIWIYSFFVRPQDLFATGENLNSSSSTKYKLVPRIIKENENSDKSIKMDYFKQNPFSCPNQTDNIIVLQTAIDPETRINVPVLDNAMMVVHFLCNESSQFGFVNKSQYHKFNKLCANQSEEYYQFFNEFKKTNSTLFNKGTIPFLDMNLVFNKTFKDVRINVVGCWPQSRFDFIIDVTRNDYGIKTIYNYTIRYTIPYDPSKCPVVLTFYNLENLIFSQINLYIRKSFNKTDDKKINSKYCPHSCNDTRHQQDMKCFLKINYTKVEIPKEPQYCSITVGKKVKKPLEINGSICEYFKKKGQNPCKYSCIDLHKCSYMCVKENENELTEIGYREPFLKYWSPLLVGSGHWSYDDIPIEMVFANECAESRQLCKHRISCLDKIVGYKCLFNDDTDICEYLKKLKGKRFWHCNPKEFYNLQFENIEDIVSDEKLNFTDKLHKVLKYYHIFFLNYKSSSKLRAKDSYAALKFSLQLLDEYIDNLLNNSNFYYHEEDKNAEVYFANVNKTEKNISIPLNNKTNNDENQFVTLILKDAVNSQSSEKLQVKYMRFKDFDMMGESKEIKSKMNTYNLDIPDSTDYAVNSSDNQVFYKNSDMFTLTINEKRNVTVQYKINTIDSITKSKTWLYQFEEKCACLDEPSSHWRWSTKDCRKITTSIPNYCECDHLSNFAVIFSMKMINKIHLDIFQYLSIIGGIINTISLMLFVIFILFINTRDKLRLDQLNIALCLLFGTVIFIFGGFCSINAILCKLAALAAQFLLLSAFVWKLIFGINVVRMLASLKRQNEDWMVKYRMGALIIGFCVPLLIVILSGSFFWSDYGEVSDKVCWIEARSKAFLTFFIPVGIILAINLIALFFIAFVLIRNYMKTSKSKVNQSSELIIFFQLVISMGVTWVPALFATVYLTAMYLFVIFFPLQGLLMFLIVVVMNRENRKKVASFIRQKYLSLRSKSTLSTDAKSSSKFGSSPRSQNIEQNQSPLSDSNKGHGKDRNPASIPMISVNGQGESTACFRHPAR